MVAREVCPLCDPCITGKPGELYRLTACPQHRADLLCQSCSGLGMIENIPGHPQAYHQCGSCRGSGMKKLSPVEIAFGAKK